MTTLDAGGYVDPWPGDTSSGAPGPTRELRDDPTCVLRYLATHSVGVFVGYRVLLGAGVLVRVGAGRIA